MWQAIQGITFSAGIAVTKPAPPVGSCSAYAEEALEAAKAYPETKQEAAKGYGSKNSVCLYGQTGYRGSNGADDEGL